MKWCSGIMTCGTFDGSISVDARAAMADWNMKYTEFLG